VGALANRTQWQRADLEGRAIDLQATLEQRGRVAAWLARGIAADRREMREILAALTQTEPLSAA
jgi:hypothetical protein